MTREEAYKVIKEIKKAVILFDREKHEALKMGMEALAKEEELNMAIEALQVRWGKWKEHTVPNAGICLKDSIECSACGYLFCKHDLTRKNYCPNCGAKMDKE